MCGGRRGVYRAAVGATVLCLEKMQGASLGGDASASLWSGAYVYIACIWRKCVLHGADTSVFREYSAPPMLASNTLPPRTRPGYSRGQPRGECRPLPAACALRSPVPGGGECRKMETSRVCCTGRMSHHMVQARSSYMGHIIRDQSSMRCHCARMPLSIT